MNFDVGWYEKKRNREMRTNSIVAWIDRGAGIFSG